MLTKYNVDKIIREEIIDFIAKKINRRAGEMIGARFGLSVEKPKTLGQIGDDYGITRERVRQIISEVMIDVQEVLNNNAILQEIEDKIKFTVKQKCGIIPEKKLLAEITKNKKEENFVNFILQCSSNLYLRKNSDMKNSVIMKDFDLAEWRDINEEVKSILKKKNDIIEESSLLKEFAQRTDNKEMEPLRFFSFLGASADVKKNVFNNWGLAEWQTISPKSVGQKAYLVIREIGRPLHFKDIAKLIEKFKFDKKKAHPQTVHNELIKDEKFVLVGRGTYALSEWGYNQGTVRDVIKGMLEDAGKPLAKEKIIEKVLELRDVQVTTVIINLNSFFTKNKNQEYFLKK